MSDALAYTSAGPVRGARFADVCVFKGVPFAAPPVGKNRLQPPRPVTPWTGVRDALSFSPKPPQTDYPDFVKLLLPEFTEPGDDCLTLNIWTTELAPARQPVMVWIPGGLYEFHATGASPLYDGMAFARDGVVCVTLSYRVGAEGFLHLGDGLSNIGLLDQIAALEWVRDNIASFGGDPNNVTVFGESAGALSIATLLVMPRAEGLFHRAIVESGGGHHVSTSETALRIGTRLADLMGVESNRSAISATPREKLLAAQAELRAEFENAPDPSFWGEVLLTALPWQPVIDGDTLPMRPIDGVRDGRSAGIDLLVGTNIDETLLFLVTSGAIDTITIEAAAAIATAYGLPADWALEIYMRRSPDASPGELFSALQTDWYWRVPALRLAEAHAAYGPGKTFMYEFAWRGSPQFNGRLGAGHSMEIPFVFKSFGPATEPLLGKNPPEPLANRMHDSWVAFARSGDPGWAGFDIACRETMRFDVKSGIVKDPMRDVCELWQGRR